MLAHTVRGQADFPFQPAATVQAAQRRRLAGIVAHAHRTVPYYRETMRRLGLGPADLDTPERLTRLPIIERAQLQRDPEYFVSSGQPLGRYLLVHSGGSGGQPRSIFHDTSSVVASGAHVERQRSVVRRLAGRRLRLREAIIESPFGTTQGVNAFLRDRLLLSSRWVIERLYLSLLDPIEHNVERLRAFRPDVVEGYGSYLEILFPYLRERDRSSAWPRVAVYGSDAMSNPARELIRTEMGVAVCSAYGAVEALHLGFECERGLGYHLNIDLVTPRIVGPGGERCRPGQSGEMIISNLVNRATVLLNYRLGDVVTELPFACPCGRSLPLISFLEGRDDDILEAASGEMLHPQAVRSLFSDVSAVLQYQIHQLAPGRFEVEVVARSGTDEVELRDLIAARFAARLGAGTQTRVTFVAR